MKNQELIRGIEAVQSVCSAYQTLRGKVKDEKQLKAAAEYALSTVLEQNPVLLHFSDTERNDVPNSVLLGSCSAPVSADGLDVVTSAISGGQFSFPLKLDFSGGSSLLLETEANGSFASVLAQYLLLSLLQSQETVFRCADLVTGGHFFAFLYQFIQSCPERSDGKISTTLYDLDNLLRFFEEASMRILSTLGGGYADLASYNASSPIKLPTYAAAIYLPSDCKDETVSRLRVLIQNAERTGMIFILIGDRATAEKCRSFADYHCVCTENDMKLASIGNIAIRCNPAISLSDELLNAVKKKLIQRGTIDTLYEHHPELQTTYLDMDSTKVLRIPFSVDQNGIVQYFELGGDAPAHALISGSTGSGKSVALHTMITQIIHHYHPDDVEIWAIDYKAVEFNTYISHHSPHFRVIGQDTSEEFSFSLLELVQEEYERRQRLFQDTGVHNITEYREKKGLRSMPRIIIFIDEFQYMTQAVQTFQGGKDYRILLENLLRVGRAMGIAFVLCSQTIAAGLNGLTEGGRDQITCRLCLKHDSDSEIRETLILSGEEASEIIPRAKNLKRGQAIYKRTLLPGESLPSGKSVEYKELNILFIKDTLKDQIIDEVTKRVGADFAPKKEIFVRSGGRFSITERVRHPIQRFLHCEYEPKEDCIEWYPAAPTSLADDFHVILEKNAGSNVLLVGEDDDLRESVVFHSLCGFLMNPANRVLASFVDETYSDRARMIGQLQRIQNPRLTLNIGLSAALDTLAALQKIRPVKEGSTIYLWYGLDKLKNEIFLRDQDMEEEKETGDGTETNEIPDNLNELQKLQKLLLKNQGIGVFGDAGKPGENGSKLSYDDCRRILMQLFEDGPENGHFSLVIFNNVKAMKKSKCLNPEHFEHKIGTKMTTDDSYEFFGSSLAGSKADEHTVVYDNGSSHTIPLHPYLMPEEDWVDTFNLILD